MEPSKPDIVDDRRAQIQLRLDQFVYKRAPMLTGSVTTTFLAFNWVLYSAQALTKTTVICSALAIVVNIARVITARNALKSSKSAGYQFKFVTLASSVLWISVFLEVNANLGNSHPANFLALLIISGFIGGTPSSLGPMSRLAATNIFILGLSAAASTLYNGHEPHDFILAGLASIYTAVMIKYAADFKKTLGFAIMERSAFESEMVSIRMLMNSIPGYMTLLDKDLRYVMVNDAFNKFVPSNVLGQRIGHMSDSNDFKLMVEQFAASNLEREIYEMKMGPTFNRQHYLVSMSKIHSPFEGIAVLTMNIEDRMQMEMELAKSRQEMEHASRLVAIGEMVSSISHEIRNPLTIIAGKAAYYKMMAAQNELNVDNVSKEADVIIKMVDRISKIIQTTLRFSRGDKDSQMKPATLRQVIDDATTVTSSKIKIECVEIKIVQSPSLDQSVECLPLQISQVLVNLISNAIDAMDGLPQKWITIEVKDCGKKCQVLVSDGGPGIPPELREKIMQPFFTTKGADKGTGLGLSISQSIVSNHQGSLTLLPEFRPTTFVIELWKQIPAAVQKAS